MPTLNDISMIRLSQTNYTMKTWKDQAKTIPQSLLDLDLLFIAKTSMSDADENAVFTLDLLDGLELVESEPNLNEVRVTIMPEKTESLPATKASALYCELLSMGPERTSLGQFIIPVRPSVKQDWDVPE